MKTLIIEDEALARKELRYLLESYPVISVIGEAVSPAEALRLIVELEPELLFLDVNLRGGTGFDLLDACVKQNPRVIFTTAHPNFAVQAFDFAAVDYLLKPIHPERLTQAISRVLAESDATTGGAAMERLDRSSRILLKNQDVSRYVAVAEISLIESEGNHSRIHASQETVVIHRSLTSVEDRLPRDLFFRANRAQIINLEAISKVEPWFSNSLRITLQDGTVIELSRRASLMFRETQGL